MRKIHVIFVQPDSKPKPKSNLINRLGHKGFRAKTKELPKPITPLWWEEVGTNLQRTFNL